MNPIDKINHALLEMSYIRTGRISLDESFSDFAARFADIPGTVVLMSGGDLDCARYHILGAMPCLTFTAKGKNITIKTDKEVLHFKADPFEILRKIMTMPNPLYAIGEEKSLCLPIICGLMGYLSYDLKDTIEKLPRTSVDDLGLPDICLFAPSLIVIHDKSENITWEAVSKFSPLHEPLSGSCKHVCKQKEINTGNFKSNFTREDYTKAIRRIKEYIAAGDVYQVNMSQRFEAEFSGNGFALFQALYEQNPAPFFAYINAGDHQIISTSPERFIWRKGERVETRPIKGTRPRGKTPAEDEALKQELQESRKDDAELSMIVDLLRNDIGKVCKAGSVKVAEHKRVEGYQNVYHLVSVVEGELDNDYGSLDLIKATFPGGSITGCPKIRSMEIIDELEPYRRHIYTGSIGYISFHHTMDLSVAIRTATILNNKIIFSVGGGIVFDSDPENEYEETLHKGRTLMNVLSAGNAKKAGDTSSYLWINGVIKPADEAGVPVSSYGFQYGYGFFETIRVQNSKPKYLDEHIARFNKTWNHLFAEEHPDLTWDKIIHQIIAKNRLENKTAAVKIIAAMGTREKPPYNDTLIVMARPYIHRLTGKKEPGLHLGTYPYPRQTPLADHKTLNYLYYFLAGKWAKANKYDEALILNPDGTVSETNTANILLIKDKKIIIPISPHVLPGIMENAVIRVLSEWGFQRENRIVTRDDLFSADHVILTNSLMGAVPLLTLDGKKIEFCSDLQKKLNMLIL